MVFVAILLEQVDYVIVGSNHFTHLKGLYEFIFENKVELSEVDMVIPADFSSNEIMNELKKKRVSGYSCDKSIVNAMKSVRLELV